ncbi:MAG: cell wall hydrolase [Clostridia bacterium]|nr:cell wall hydrolase [Clostridia bacterium]
MKARYRFKDLTVKITSFFLSIILLFILTVGTNAEHYPQVGQADSVTSVSAERSTQKSVTVYVNKEKYGGKAYLINSVTYVGIREFSMHMGVTSVSWNSEKKTATVKSDSLSISAKNKSLYIIANGRYLWAGSGVIIKNSTMYVPLRTIAKAFGADVSWNKKEFAAYVSGSKTITEGNSYYNSNDLYWLSRIIHAEAEGESLLGKVAVGTVVQNRVKSSLFPNTVHSVIFDKKNGVQFTPTVNGAINCTPSEDSIIAAKLCLDGASISDNALFFVNEALAENSWVSDNREFIVAVGNHKFYS